MRPHCRLPHQPARVACLETPLETGEAGRAVLEIIFAAYESAGTGRKVALPFAPPAMGSPIRGLGPATGCVFSCWRPRQPSQPRRQRRTPMPDYIIRRTPEPPSLTGDWEGALWSRAQTGVISHYLPNSSDHHPPVTFRLLYDPAWVYLLFRVEDRFVRCVETAFNGSVCRDSCTEFFVEPRAGKGYFNFEVNCGGTMLCYYVEDATPTATGFRKSVALTPEEDAQVRRYHSLPAVVEPEIVEAVTWYNEIHIPLALLEGYVGALGDPAGQVWRANLYKCGDETSHPHWGTWAPIEGESFHVPQYFAPLTFEV